MNKRQKAFEELARPYIKDPSSRSVNTDGKCLYNGPDGKHCLFAKACTKKAQDNILIRHENKPANGVINSEGERILKKKYKELFSSKEWRMMQSFHDLPTYWTETGLSNYGSIFYNEIMSSLANEKVW